MFWNLIALLVVLALVVNVMGWLYNRGRGDVERRAREHVNEICEEHDLPVDGSDVHVREVSFDKPTYLGCHSAVGLFVTHSGTKEDPIPPRYIWGHVIEVSTDWYGEGDNMYSELLGHASDSLEGTVRHELAHACAFAEDGYTDECEGNHMEWLKRLDAEHTTYDA